MTDERADDPVTDAVTDPDQSPKGGDQTTADQLEADNEVEEDMLKTLDPGAPPA